MDEHTLGTKVGLGPGHIGPAPPKKEHSPHFSALVCYNQTAGWINMPLGTKAGLGPGHIVLDGDAAPLQQKGHSPPAIFDPCLLWPNGWFSAHVYCYQTAGWIKMPLGTELGLGPDDIV